MKKASLLPVAALAAVTVLLHCQSGHCASSDPQIEQLKDQFLPAQYKNKSLTLDDVKRFVREKCKRASGSGNPALSLDIERSAVVVTDCISNIANFTAIQEEVEAARPRGELDTVFEKYCSRAPEVQQCLATFNAKLQPCLTPEERQQNAVMVRVVDGLIRFMCYKGGDQIALFVAEQGPECLEANKEAIGSCMNASFAEYMPKDGSVPNLLHLPELVLSPQHCFDMERFEHCTLHHLEQCQDFTPANVAESVFRFVKNETSCKQIIEAEKNRVPVLRANTTGNAASRERVSAALLLLVLLLSVAMLLSSRAL